MSLTPMSIVRTEWNNRKSLSSGVSKTCGFMSGYRIAVGGCGEVPEAA